MKNNELLHLYSMGTSAPLPSFCHQVEQISRKFKYFGIISFARALLSTAMLRAAILSSPIWSGESSHISPALVLLEFTLESARPLTLVLF